MATLTPDELAAPGTEHAYQTAFFCAISSPQLYLPALPNSLWHLLPMVHAIPSGGARDVVTAGRLKAEGVRPGIPDVHVPVARFHYHSLYIEFKKPERQNSRDGGMSPAQVKMKHMLEAEGNLVTVAYGHLHATSILTWYLTEARAAE
jgi:hypothetical protein